MKKYLLIAVILPFIFSCKRETMPSNDNLELGTVKFTTLQSEKAFTGALEIFPCTQNTTTYVGNYRLNAVSAINPSCIITKGTISTWGYELLLPLGSYNLLYWGISNLPMYSPSRVSPPSLSLGVDMSSLYWSLVLNPDKTTYMPVWDQVMATQEVEIGSSDISIDLVRQVAGLNVVVKNSNGLPFDRSITAIEVLVGGIAEKINAATGAPVNQTKTVRFALSIDPTSRLSANNVTAMLYPSAPSPEITIKIKLNNGQTKSYTTTLQNAFQANTAQTVTILMADILSSDPGGSTFTVDGWNEISETIDAPILSAAKKR